MGEVDMQRILESVADATGNRDVVRLRQSLLRTLGELLPLRTAAFVHLGVGQPITGDVPAHALAWLRSHQPPQRSSLLLDYSRVELEPVTESEGLLIEVNGHGDAHLGMLRAFARVYTNFVTLIRESEQDRLTGLLNRRSFDAELVDGLRRQWRQDGSSEPQRWLALVDIDHFKRINDRFGHLYGDEVLLLVARLLQDWAGEHDRCYRYGGEEFAILFSADGMADAVARLEALRETISQHRFPRVGQVTASLGCAGLRPGIAPAELIDRADRALYAAKHAGRNRLVSEGRDVCTGRLTPDSEPRRLAYGEVDLF